MPKSYEDELQLLIDKVEGVDDRSWEEMVDELGLSIHPDSLRKSFNAGRYSGYAVAKHYQEKFENEYCSQEEIDRLEGLKKELIKERVKLSDARREYKKYLSNEARYENLVDVLKRGLKDIEPLPYESFGKYADSFDKGKSAILCISDIHYGAVCDSKWNYYSTDVARDRIWQLMDKVRQYCTDMNITNLVVEVNGDCIEGGINTSNRVASEEDVVTQIIEVSQLLAEAINSLKPYVRTLKVVTTLGNHGRLTPNKKDQGDEKENFELLIPEMLRMILDKDIPIISSQGMDFVKYDFNGRTICLTHGHHDKVNSAINNMIRVFKEVPDEVHIGHTHHHHDINDSNIYVVVNGSIKGTDDFGLGTTRCVTKPSQNLIVYGEDRMVIEIIVD